MGTGNHRNPGTQRHSERRSGRPARSPGFTLLELLLAITLLGLIAVMLAGGIRLGARVWETGEEHAEELARLEVVQGFLRRQLSQAHPLALPNNGSRRRYAFEGGPERLQFAALAPPQFGLGGFSLLTLDLDEGEQGKRLRLGWRLYHPEMAERPGPGEGRETVLAEGVAGIAFSYYGAPRRGEPPQWRDRWEGKRELPRLVRLRLEFADGRYWPELVVAPRVGR